MSTWLIAAVTVAYLGVAIDQALKSQWSMATVYVGYAIANIGFIAAVK